MKRILTLASALLLISGCSSLQDFRAGARTSPPISPGLVLPERFIATARMPIQLFSDDIVLREILAQVPQAPDVAVAQSRLAEATAKLAAARAGLWPNLSGSTTVSAAGAQGTKSVTSGVIGSNLSVPIDLFGANRNRVDAQAARVQEASYSEARTKSLTQATLRQLYISLRTAQAQIVVTRDNLASSNDSLLLATVRQRAGLETGLGIAQATNNRDTIGARLPGFEQGERAARLGIEAILGKLPTSLEQQLSTAQPIPRFNLAGAEVAPALWLSNRADLLAAQQRLQSAGLDAMAAKKDRYPSLSLSTLISQTSASQGFTGLAGSTSVNLLTSLFDFGRLEALARAASAGAQIQAELYKQAVVNAVSDVEVQASRTSQAEAATNAQSAAVQSAQDQARLARVRYTSGLSDFLAVLTAERSVYEAQSAKVAAQGEAASAQAALILALGL